VTGGKTGSCTFEREQEHHVTLSIRFQEYAIVILSHHIKMLAKEGHGHATGKVVDGAMISHQCRQSLVERCNQVWIQHLSSSEETTQNGTWQILRVLESARCGEYLLSSGGNVRGWDDTGQVCRWRKQDLHIAIVRVQNPLWNFPIITPLSRSAIISLLLIIAHA
jgi:hypothetical protein